MPVPGFLSSFADKAQNAINNSSLSQHIPGSLTGRISPAASGGGSGSGEAGGFKQNHTFEQIQYQFRQIQQSYSATGPIQKLITTEKGVALDFDSVNRNAQAQSKELYTWGQNEEPDVKDVSDRMAFLNYIAGALSNTLAVKLNAARTPLKALRDSEVSLSARRNARAGLQSQIVRLEHGQERGYEKRVAELKDQLSKAERDDEPSEKEHEILKRKALKESEELKFAALREYGEKLSLLSQASEAILSALPSIPPSSASPYSSTEQTGAVRAALQHALDNWTPGQTTLSTTGGGAKLDRANTRSFGETHATELSAINSAEPHSQTASRLPASPPLPGSTHPAIATGEVSPGATRTTATSVPAPTPIPVQGLRGTSAPLTSSPSPVAAPGQSASPTINPANLNNSPTSIPVPSLTTAVASPNPNQPEEKVPSVTPTIAETGVPVSAGADGPGPVSGSLHDIRAPTSGPRLSVSSPYGSVPSTIAEEAPPAVHGAGTYESAEDEKKRLAREERERVLQGSAGGPSAAPSHASAEEEKARLEREERDRVLRGLGQPPPPPADGPPKSDDGDTPPPYQDL